MYIPLPKLAFEFVKRYEQLTGDFKTRKRAIEILRYEFKNKLVETIEPDTFLFTDRSSCTYEDYGWTVTNQI